jgi:hypothetical protein
MLELVKCRAMLDSNIFDGYILSMALRPEANGKGNVYRQITLVATPATFETIARIQEEQDRSFAWVVVSLIEEALSARKTMEDENK